MVGICSAKRATSTAGETEDPCTPMATLALSTWLVGEWDISGTEPTGWGEDNSQSAASMPPAATLAWLTILTDMGECSGAKPSGKLVAPSLLTLGLSSQTSLLRFLRLSSCRTNLAFLTSHFSCWGSKTRYLSSSLRSHRLCRSAFCLAIRRFSSSSSAIFMTVASWSCLSSSRSQPSSLTLRADVSSSCCLSCRSRSACSYSSHNCCADAGSSPSEHGCWAQSHRRLFSAFSS